MTARSLARVCCVDRAGFKGSLGVHDRSFRPTINEMFAQVVAMTMGELVSYWAMPYTRIVVAYSLFSLKAVNGMDIDALKLAEEHQ